MNTVDTLIEFIARAERDRKYPPNTAVAFKRPFDLINPELNDQEKNSLEILESRIDQILNTIYNREDSSLSSSSLQEYKRRIRRVITDYKAYGKDPSKMASWNRIIKIRKPKEKINHRDDISITTTGTSSSEDLTRFELPLTSGKAIIFTPSKLRKADIIKIKAYVNFLEQSLLETEKSNQTWEG